MQYETGIKDKYGNVAYDWIKVCKDMKRMIAGKIKFSKALYHVMMQRFTIAHYDRHGWFNTYNGHWDQLAQQIDPAAAATGDLQLSEEDVNAIYELKAFLNTYHYVELNEETSL